MKKIISLIGCGWLGQQLIPHLQPAYRLIATSRRARVLSIPTYPYHVHTDPLPAPIRDAHALIIALPPRAAAASDIARLIAQIPASTPFILVSSTSVYPQAPGNYDENSALRSDHPVTQIENAARTHPFAMIVRSGGQYGAGRLPLKTPAQTNASTSSRAPTSAAPSPPCYTRRIPVSTTSSNPNTPGAAASPVAFPARRAAFMPTAPPHAS